MTKKLLAAALFLTLATLSCNILTGNPSPTPSPFPELSLGQLDFADQALGARLQALDACTQKLPGEGWRSLPYRPVGNFYEAHWCRGSGSREDCQITEGSGYARDQHAIALYTLFYPQDFPQVFGLGMSALWNPPGAGWGAHFSYSEGGRSVVGEGFQLSFFGYGSDEGEPDTTVVLGSQIGYPLGQGDRTLAASGQSPAEDLRRYMASPEALRDEGLAQLGQAQQELEDLLRSGEAIACDYGPYLGKGIPPQCTPRPLTPDEQALELEKARTHFKTQETMLREHYDEMYAAWMKALPLDWCWR
jgi:hypothetical protein